jgi:Tfp pilus assembly protein PilN
MKPRLNLATAPLENQRRFLAVAFGVGLPALLIFAVLAGAAYSDWRSTRERRAEVARLESELRDFERRRADLENSFAKPETKQVMERAAFLNGLIEQRSFPWTKMFIDLERELPAGVHVVSLSPRMQAGGVEVHMVVAAASDRGKLEFLRTLESSSEFTDLVVVSETRPSRQEDTTDTVKVELVAQYSAAEEKRAPAVKSGEAPPEKPAGLPRAKLTGKHAEKAAAKIAENQRESKPGDKRGDKRGAIQ